MLGSLGRVGGRGGAGSAPVFGARLVQPGAIGGGGIVTFSRSQVSSFSTATNAAGSVVEYVADVPRFNGASQQLLLEGQSTNQIRNSRAEGISGGSAPTYWTAQFSTGTGNGVTRTVRAWSGGGFSGIDIDLDGTCTGTNTSIPQFEVASFIPAVNAQVWTMSLYMAYVRGTPSQVPMQFGIRMTDSGGTTLGGGGLLSSSITLTNTLSRYALTATLNQPTVAWISPGLRYTMTSGVTYAETLRIVFPQLELTPFASTIILPPLGTPGTSTRGQDNLTSNFSTLFPTGVGTVLASFMLPQNAVSVDQMLFDISDGTVNNRIRVRNVAGGATIVAGRVIGGVGTDATTLGSMTAGTLFRVGLTFDGTTITANFNGGSNQTVSGQPTGLTTLRVGNNSAGTNPMFGECGYFDVLPYVIPGANLPAAVAAIP